MARSCDKKIEMAKTVGINLKLNRVCKNMSQEQLSERLGITYQQVQKYEAGTNLMPINRILEACDILNIPLSALIERDENAEELAGDSEHINRVARLYPTILDICRKADDTKVLNRWIALGKAITGAYHEA